MEQKSQFWTSAMRYGLYLGITLVVLIAIVNALGPNGKYIGWIQWVILTAGVYMSQYSYRNNELGGFISYGKCLKLGIIVMMCASIFVSLYTYIYVKYIDLSYLENIKIQMEEVMLQQNVPEYQIETMSQMFSRMQTPEMIFFSGLFGFAFFGFIISLITSTFVKKDNDVDAFDQAMTGIED
jgi:hypothetical protein